MSPAFELIVVKNSAVRFEVFFKFNTFKIGQFWDAYGGSLHGQLVYSPRRYLSRSFIFPGFRDENGAWHFIFSPKEGKIFRYTIKSTHPALDGHGGAFTSYWLTPDLATKPSPRYPNWWTDGPDPAVAEGNFAGAKTVSMWRAKFLRDFAARIERCKAPDFRRPSEEPETLN